MTGMAPSKRISCFEQMVKLSLTPVKAKLRDQKAQIRAGRGPGKGPQRCHFVDLVIPPRGQDFHSSENLLRLQKRRLVRIIGSSSLET